MNGCGLDRYSLHELGLVGIVVHMALDFIIFVQPWLQLILMEIPTTCCQSQIHHAAAAAINTVLGLFLAAKLILCDSFAHGGRGRDTALHCLDERVDVVGTRPFLVG